MIAFKGFNSKLQSVMGNGDRKTCNFKLGETLEVPNCKTAKNGFHCYENPLMLPTYYAMDGQNRYFKVRAEGNIDEDDAERIACTRITLIEELTPWMLAMEGMKFMIEHPLRENWQQSHKNVQVKADKCEAMSAGHIAIARGENPIVKGPEGCILGMIVEKDGEITDAKMLMPNKEQAGKWLRCKQSGPQEREVEIVEESES